MIIRRAIPLYKFDDILRHVDTHNIIKISEVKDDYYQYYDCDRNIYGQSWSWLIEEVYFKNIDYIQIWSQLIS